MENFFVPLVCSAVVPEPVDHDFFPLRRLPEGDAALQILFKGHVQIVGLKSVEGDIDFVQPRGVQQDVPPGGKQGAVGGQNHLEARLMGHGEIVFQIRVAQGFTHEMEIQEIRKRAQLLKRQREMGSIHSPGTAVRPGAEGAA